MLNFKISSVLIIVSAIIGISLSFIYFYNQTNTAKLSVTTITGQSFYLADLLGKPVLINFWASDCPACMEEIPLLTEFYQRNRDVAVLAVAMPYDPPNRVLNIVNSRQIPYPIALDPQAEISNAFGKVVNTPAWFLLNAKGNIIYKKLGKLNWQELQQTLDAESF